MEVEWHNLADNHLIHLDQEDCELIEAAAESRHGSLSALGKETGLGEALYSNFRYRNQGIRVGNLKQVLDSLGLGWDAIGQHTYRIGMYKKIEINPPLQFTAALGQLLAHAFFDGYADDMILRYSSYDPDIREEFVESVHNVMNGVEMPVNRPEDVRNDIDLPAFVSRLLKEIFDIETFYGSECRVPSTFYDLIEEDRDYGWFFLKGAYLDEGSVTSGGIYVVRGIRNQGLAQDVQDICEMLDLTTSMRETNRDAYSIRVISDSVLRFVGKVRKKFFTSVGKWNRVNRIVGRRKKRIEKEDDVLQDYKRIIQELKKREPLLKEDIEKICDCSKNQAYFRIHLLVYNGNVEKKKEGRTNKYLLRDDDLSGLPDINEMKRAKGWRK